MSEKQRPDINPMPLFEMLPPRINPLELVAHGVVRAIRSVPELFKMHQLASHGDHLPSSVDEMLLDDRHPHPNYEIALENVVGNLDNAGWLDDAQKADLLNVWKDTFKPSE